MKILVGAATKTDVIKDAILKIEDPMFTYIGKDGMYMVYECENPNDKDIVRLIKDTLKSEPALSMVYFNVSSKN